MLSFIFSLGGWLQETASTSPSVLFFLSSSRAHALQTSLVKTCSQLLDITGKTSRCLGRESELVRVCCCLFGPMINEANEPSSACSPELRRPVETRTPPLGITYLEYRGILGTCNRLLWLVSSQTSPRDIREKLLSASDVPIGSCLRPFLLIRLIKGSSTSSLRLR